MKCPKCGSGAWLEEYGELGSDIKYAMWKCAGGHTFDTDKTINRNKLVSALCAPKEIKADPKKRKRSQSDIQCKAEGCDTYITKGGKHGYCGKHTRSCPDNLCKKCGAPMRVENTRGYCAGCVQYSGGRVCNHQECKREIPDNSTTGRCINHPLRENYEKRSRLLTHT